MTGSPGEVGERHIFNDVKKDQISSDIVLERLNEWWELRLYDARNDNTQLDRLRADIETWKQTNSEKEKPTTIAFTSGVFDLMHTDHHGYLLRTKAAAVPLHFDRYYSEQVGVNWGDLPENEQAPLILDLLRRGEIKLIVSADGNKSVGDRKGNDPTKGGVRPVLGWNTRARQIASITLPGGEGTVVDAVTIHGPADFESGSPHASIVDLAAAIKPDVWSVYCESTDILEVVPHDKRFGDTIVVEMPSSKTFFQDELQEGKMSTSQIIKRMTGVS